MLHIDAGLLSDATKGRESRAARWAAANGLDPARVRARDIGVDVVGKTITVQLFRTPRVIDGSGRAYEADEVTVPMVHDLSEFGL